MTVRHFNGAKNLVKTEFYRNDYSLSEIHHVDGRIFIFASDGITLISVDYPDGKKVLYEQNDSFSPGQIGDGLRNIHNGACKYAVKEVKG